MRKDDLKKKANIEQEDVHQVFYPELPIADFNNLGFEVYNTAKMCLYEHITSAGKTKGEIWPDSCMEMGWQKYYSTDHEEKGWRAPEGGPLMDVKKLALHPSACVLHYAVSAFEGTKAFYSAKGNLVLFRPLENGKRLQETAARLLMPKVPLDIFMESVRQTALANIAYVPEYHEENWRWESRNPRSFYIRPLLMAHGPMIGVNPSKDHLYFVYGTPVRAYYPIEGLRVLVSSSFHRAAPGGIGAAKAAANYTPGILASQLAKRGYDWRGGKPVKITDEPFHDVLYLDAAENKYIEEFSGANFYAVLADGTLVTPDSDSVLPGITCASVEILARDLGIKVERRPIAVDEVLDETHVKEAFCTGNAANITPITSLTHNDRLRSFNASSSGVAKKIWETLINIQFQIEDDPYGWIETL